MAVKQVTIANGASVSDGLHLKTSHVAAIFMPAAWTAADIVIEGSLNGQDFLPLYDAAGDDLSVVVAASRMVVLTPEATQGVPYVRLRSALAGVAVNQQAQRQIKLEVAT